MSSDKPILNMPTDQDLPAGGLSAPPIDLEVLAKKVYDLLRRELRLERERSGQTRTRRLG